MIILLVLGVFIFFIGVLLFVAPQALSKASRFLDRKIGDDSAIYSHRILVGIICLLIGGALLWMSWGLHGM